MPVVEVIYKGKATYPEILRRLHFELQEIVVRALSTRSVKLNKDDIDLVFEKGERINIDKNLKIIVFANDFLERLINVQERSE
jgi:propanediol utilization protein